MFSKTELYDHIYGSFKDYAADCARIAAVLRERAPAAQRILDVACGTGEHARHLRSEHGYAVDGLDIEPGFVQLARAKLPQAQVWAGDMANFEVPARYDAILCLFSSIGYVRTLDRVTATLRCPSAPRAGRAGSRRAVVHTEPLDTRSSLRSYE